MYNLVESIDICPSCAEEFGTIHNLVNVITGCALGVPKQCGFCGAFFGVTRITADQAKAMMEINHIEFFPQQLGDMVREPIQWTGF